MKREIYCKNNSNIIRLDGIYCYYRLNVGMVIYGKFGSEPEIALTVLSPEIILH